MPNKSQKEWLLRAVDAFSERFIVVSPEFEIIAASSSTKVPLSGDIIGEKCHDVFNERSSPCVNCAVEEAMSTNSAVLQPKPEIDFGKRRMPCHYAYPLYKKGKVEAYVSIDFDLPVRKGLEETLQRSNTFLRKLLTSAVDAVIAADKRGRILIYNNIAAKILGYDAGKVSQEMNITDIYPGRTASEVMEKMRSDEYGEKGNLQYYHVDLITKTGETIPISLNAAIVYEGDKEIATIGYFHDMREELRIKKELRKAQMQLLQAEKMASIGMLASGVAHEINNPVAIMIETAGWISDLLKEEIFQGNEYLDEFNRALRQIKTQGKRCNLITRKLLGFARKTDTGIQSICLNETVKDVVSLCTQRAKKSGVVLRTFLQEPLPATPVSGSEMQQVLLNLIHNALDAVEDRSGTITLTTGVEGGQVLLDVSDDGPGIPEKDLPHVFDPFFTTKPVGKGTGLGLFICYSIVKSMGGKIDVKSEKNTGTTFSLKIPYLKSLFS